jgi:ribulose-phosphate 3-epimerase
MDGSFVPPITFGDNMVATAKRCSTLPLDVHLMINRPENHIEAFKAAGATRLTVHQEACPHLHRVLGAIRSAGLAAGVALNPGTPVTQLFEVLELVDLVLVMTVNPGFGGQSFIEECVPKIQRLEAWRREMGLKFRIQVDGGINDITGRECARAGANVFVAGTHLFGKRNMGQAVQRLRERLIPAAQELI